MQRDENGRRNLRTQHSKTENCLLASKRAQGRQKNAQNSRTKRAMAADTKRNIEIEPEEPQEEVKLPYNERYKIWKKEQEAKRKLEAENKKKQRPAFKPGGSINNIKPVVPTKKPNKTITTAAKVNTNNATCTKTNKKLNIDKNINNKSIATDLTKAIENLSVEPTQDLNSTFTLPDEPIVENSKDDSHIEVLNERNEVIYITPSTRVTRSRKRQDGNADLEITRNETNIIKDLRKTPVKTSIIKTENTRNNTKTPDTKHRKSTTHTPVNHGTKSDDQKNSPSEISQNFKTPEKENEIPEFLSAFVTTSRGKNSARKEKISRRSVLTYQEDNSPQHRRIQADYYRKVLDNEIKRLMSIHDEWEKYKEVNIGDLSEDSVDLINTALGQTKLLIRSKFEQFRNLIEESVLNEGRKVTETDLSGFWDMVFIQVENINMRYNNLVKLRENNWVEFEPVEVVKKEKTKKIKPFFMKTTRTGSSRMKDIIRAGRMKQQSTKNNLNNSKRNSITSSPRINNKTSHANKSLLSNVLKSQANKDRNNSFSSFEKECNNDTPTKSILKTPGLNKSLSGKAVLFRRSDCNEIIDFDETLPVGQVRTLNDTKVRESINLISWDSPDEPLVEKQNMSTPQNTRRSIQLNKGVLS